MSLVSRAIGHLIGLPAVRVDVVDVERDLPVELPDGTVLLADRWFPVMGGAQRPPTILIRSPYGRRPMDLVARLFAERGYQVMVQSCRGTFGSGGAWEPFRNERADGLATLEWVASQPWFGGSLATFGASYLGLAQWAVAAEAPEFVRAMALDVTTARFREAVVYPGGSFALETGAAWLYLLAHQELGLRRVVMAQIKARRVMARSSLTLPLAVADAALLGTTVDCYQEWLVHDKANDPWWDFVDFRKAVDHLPPSSLMGGWYDIFLPQQVDDYVALCDAGRDTRLVIGPWTHASPRGLGAAVSDGLDLFDSTLRGMARRHASPVRLYVMGSRRWVDLPGWPPPAQRQRWHLHAGGRLDPAPPEPSVADRYRYDPADPTPGVGGPSLNWLTAGPKDQRRREIRPDVLTYTSDPLVTEVTVAGPMEAEIWLASTLQHTDLFVRLCDVSEKGKSINVSDGILRLGETTDPGDTDPGGGADGEEPTEAVGGLRKVQLSMWPTAITFRRGHRIRLQVSSGAHPLFARNLGSGEPLGTGTTLRAADVEVLHDPAHPSAVFLPVSPI